MEKLKSTSEEKLKFYMAMDKEELAKQVIDIQGQLDYAEWLKLSERVRDIELFIGKPCPGCESHNIKSDDYGHRWCDDCEPDKYK